MITKEQLKDWLDTNARKEKFEILKKYINSQIKKNALKGTTTFYISSGEANNIRRTHQRTVFYDLWHCKGLSDDSTRVVQKEIIDAYKKAGFDIQVVNIDCGWNSNYKGLQFKNIHKMLED